MTSATRAVRYEWVDFAKGMAMLAVVYFHVTLFFGEVGVDNALGRVKLAFELFPMPAFFLLSGLLNRRASTWTFAELWRRRLLPILYIYVLWSLVRFGFYMAFPMLATDAADMAPTNPLTIALLPVLPTSSYWFIYALALFTLASWLLRKIPAAVHLALAAALSAAVTSGWLNTHTIAWDRIGALFFFFLLGSIESKRIRIIVSRAPPWAIVVAVVALLGVIAAMFLARGVIRIPFVVLAGQMLAVFVGFQVARLLCQFRALGWVSTVGRQSLTIYLLHLFLIAPLAYGMSFLGPDWSRPVDVLVCVVATALVVLSCLLFARVTSRARWLYSPPTWMSGSRRRLSGSRPTRPTATAP